MARLNFFLLVFESVSLLSLLMFGVYRTVYRSQQSCLTQRGLEIRYRGDPL